MKAVGTPQCDVCGEGKIGWCHHLTVYIQKGHDAHELDFGIRFEVPIVASSKLFATVQISTEDIAEVCAPMFLIVESLFTDDETEHPLGLWNKGEGLWSIRSVILDWVRAQCHIDSFNDPAHCPSSSHTMKHSREYINKVKQQEGYNFLNSWVIATYGLCLPQYSEVANFNSGMFIPEADERLNSQLMTGVQKKVGKK